MISIQDICSLSEFQRNTKDFLTRMKQSRTPVVLTVNGKAEIVVQDAASYQEMLDRLQRAEAASAIRQGIADFANGNDIDADEALESIRAKYGISR